MNAWLANLQPPPWLAAGLTQLEPYALPFGGLIALALAVLLVRSVRRADTDTLAVRVAVVLASAFSAQGMYEVATQRLHMPWWIAGGLFIVAEAGMLASGVRAHRMWEKCNRLGPHGRFVWIIATVAGFTVSLNARSASEYVLRLAMPLLAAGLWWMGYVTEDARAKAVDAITYRWSLRRLGVVLGVIEPGDRDLATVNADRLIRRMTTHAHGVHHGWLLRGWHRTRLRRLTLLANDDAVVDEVQRRIERVHYIVSATAPTGAQTPEHAVLRSGWWLAPWSAVRSATRSSEALRSEQIAERHRSEQEALRSAETLRSEREQAERETERIRSEHTAAVARILVENAAAAEDLRQQLAAERSAAPQPERSAPVRSGAPRSGARPSGAEQNGGAPRYTDAEAVALMLRTHRGATYDWGPREVNTLTGAGFGRIKKLIAMVAEHHERSTAEQATGAGDDDSERQPVAATG